MSSYDFETLLQMSEALVETKRRKYVSCLPMSNKKLANVRQNTKLIGSHATDPQSEYQMRHTFDNRCILGCERVQVHRGHVDSAFEI